ncbi:MAG: archease [Bacillota bacterium]
MRGYRFLDHTADVGLEASGETLEEAFGNAASGLFALIAEGPVAPADEVRVEVAAGDLEELLVRWLNELLYLHNTERRLFSRFSLHIFSGERTAPASLKLEARAFGEKADPGRHGRLREVKAATYHGLRLDRRGPGASGRYLIRVIFDV